MNFSVQPPFNFLQKFRSILLPFAVDQAKDYVLDLTKAMENDPAPVVQTMTEEEEQQNRIPAVKLVVEPVTSSSKYTLYILP
jgi:hypothetical protein